MGLALWRNASGAWVATDCDRAAPEALRAAVAAPDTDCSAPVVRSIAPVGAVRRGAITRFRIATSGAAGRLDRLEIAWGDGSRNTVRLSASRGSGAVVVRHRVRRSGRFRVQVTASAAPHLACQVFGPLGPRVSSPPRTVVVRARA